MRCLRDPGARQRWLASRGRGGCPGAVRFIGPLTCCIASGLARSGTRGCGAQPDSANAFLCPLGCCPRGNACSSGRGDEGHLAPRRHRADSSLSARVLGCVAAVESPRDWTAHRVPIESPHSRGYGMGLGAHQPGALSCRPRRSGAGGTASCRADLSVRRNRDLRLPEGARWQELHPDLSRRQPSSGGGLGPPAARLARDHFAGRIDGSRPGRRSCRPVDLTGPSGLSSLRDDRHG